MDILCKSLFCLCNDALSCIDDLNPENYIKEGHGFYLLDKENVVRVIMIR